MNSLPTGLFVVVAVSMMYFGVMCGPSDETFCVPCSRYRNDCNICWCLADGSDGYCTKRGCVPNETYGPLCTANEVTIKGGLTCTCGPTGEYELCDDGRCS